MKTTFIYTETLCNIETLPDGQIKRTPTGKKEHIYSIQCLPSVIIVNGRKMRVVENDEFRYKCQKTQIKAIDGAKGLFEFIESHKDFGAVWVRSICDHVIKYGIINNIRQWKRNIITNIIGCALTYATAAYVLNYSMTCIQQNCINR